MLKSILISVVNLQKSCSNYNSIIGQLNGSAYELENEVLAPLVTDELEKSLIDRMQKYDIVIVIGKDLFKFYKSTIEIFHEDNKWTTVIYKGLQFTIPKSFSLVSDAVNKYPISYLHRIYFVEIFEQGKVEIPHLFQHIKCLQLNPVYSKKYFLCDSNDRNFIEKSLEALKGENADVSIYYDLNNPLEVKIESENVQSLVKVQSSLRKSLKILQEETLFGNIDCIFNSTEYNTQQAIDHIKNCFEKYTPENVFLSFNGGKDCTVLLHLTMIVLKKYYPHFKKPIFCMYVQSQKPFAEVNNFIDLMKEFYNLEINTYTMGIKEALEMVLENMPNLKAVLMGTRRTDPFCENLTHFKPTDNGWPNLMRVSPLLDWDYPYIWDYLLKNKVPYCELYDLGFTSLGNVDNTERNPYLKLKVCNNNSRNGFLKAYKLLDVKTERSGRLKSAP